MDGSDPSIPHGHVLQPEKQHALLPPDQSHVCEVPFPIEQDVWSLLPSVFVPEFWSSRIQWKLQLFRPLFRIFSDSSFLLLLEAAQVWLLLPSVSPGILWQDLNNQF